MKDTRSSIQKAAYDMMGTSGLEEVHARTVAASIKINHATVHYYFPKREDLLVGVADFAMQTLHEDRKRFQAGVTDAKGKIGAEMSLAEAYAKKGSRFAKVLAGLVVASSGSAKLKKKVKDLFAEWASVCTKEMAGAKPKKGAALADPDLMMATLFGLALGNLALDGSVNVEAKLDTVYDSLFA
ncbi:MAG: TetR/AcrR family transcriptional regulator [Fimbriimonadaceae bacterium]